MADVAASVDRCGASVRLPVVLVIGLRPGCLSQAVQRLPTNRTPYY
jgi:hypothetical protein